jgi:hypothetical protein
MEALRLATSFPDTQNGANYISRRKITILEGQRLLDELKQASR